MEKEGTLSDGMVGVWLVRGHDIMTLFHPLAIIEGPLIGIGIAAT